MVFFDSKESVFFYYVIYKFLVNLYNPLSLLILVEIRDIALGFRLFFQKKSFKTSKNRLIFSKNLYVFIDLSNVTYQISKRVDLF